MHSSLKILRLKGILMLHHTLKDDLNVQYRIAQAKSGVLITELEVQFDFAILFEPIWVFFFVCLFSLVFLFLFFQNETLKFSFLVIKKVI